ncbi:MAG: hypothetical protein KC777_21950 [Cyanobacteria bacterium HKST-UBA02]|nr:hypothetical protein [Cyanobacteria bacterium HKST-UBA02]
MYGLIDIISKAFLMAMVIAPFYGITSGDRRLIIYSAAIFVLAFASVGFGLFMVFRNRRIARLNSLENRQSGSQS